MTHLTEGQLHVLALAHQAGGIKKGALYGNYWRNVDQLERRGLISRQFGGSYVTTEAGTVALVGDSPLAFEDHCHE